MNSYRHPKVYERDETETRRQPSVFRRVAAVGGVALALVGAALLSKKDTPALEGPRDAYMLQNGDNAANVAERVEATHDGVAGNENITPIADDIHGQLGADGVGQPGDTVMLTEKADIDPAQPGVQLPPVDSQS